MKYVGNLITWLSLILSLIHIYRGESDIKVEVAKLLPSQVAIVQFDSRTPLTDYWLASAQWNEAYCRRHGHKFLYFATAYSGDDQKWCIKDVLASPWCKVKSMVEATIQYPDIKLFLYMDSDAVIDKNFADISLNKLLGIMQEKINWDPIRQPVVFNQDGPCWWCTLVSKVGYSMCLNAGTVVWYQSDLGLKLLQKWWNSAMDSYLTNNPLQRKYRIKWPWEQDRQMWIYNTSKDSIAIASDPHHAYQSRYAGKKDWCLSHLPESGCFVSHYCANSHSKQVMKRLYQQQQYLQLDENSHPASLNTSLIILASHT